MTTINEPHINVSHYSYRVTWSPEDAEFLATCSELSSLSFLDPDQVTALNGIQDLVAEVIHDLLASGEVVPEPLSHRKYSGKFNLRVGPELHRQLARDASEAGTSLNQYIVRRLVGE